MADEIVVSTSNQTPIEIALGIDEQGMTTASRLYEFLELNPSNYSKWFKTNIANNKFAEVNVDYIWLVLKYESGTGIIKERQDAKITASFAKKLSMASKSAKGEEAREYFLRTEEALKQVVVSQRPDELLQLKSQAYDLMMQNRELTQRISQLEQNQRELVDKLDGNTPQATREVLAECLQDISRALLGNSIIDIPKEHTNNHPITESQLSSIRMAVRECVSNQVRILETRYFSIPSRASAGVCRILQNNIYNTIKDTIGTRHTKADRSQYGQIMQIVSDYHMDVKLIERIRVYINCWRDRGLNTKEK